MDPTQATVTVQPMQWGSLPYMGDADLVPFSAADAACFRDIRDALKKHGALTRFGVFLIHKHFEIGDDEQLVECTDTATRRSMIAPQKTAGIDPEATITTNWIFSDSEEVAVAQCTCAKGMDGH